MLPRKFLLSGSISIQVFIQVTLFLIIEGNRSKIGFGSSRLKSFRGHGLNYFMENGDPVDPLAVEKLFVEAVTDNFAPVYEQTPWFSGGPRYWTNDRFCNTDANRCSKGPLFLYIGGEGPLSGKAVSASMSMYRFAEENHALMVALEHRFYGKSFPFNDTSLESLKYLSSQQALADLARFIPAVKEEFKMDDSAKVITFGGSYPGSLSAWMRLKYPHLVDGAIASSAPILAQLNFPEYMDVCQSSLAHFGGNDCTEILEGGVNALATLLQGSGADLSSVSSDFGTCTPLNTADDVWVFASNIMGDIQGTVQYNRQKSGVYNVTDICNALLHSDKDAVNSGSLRLYSQEAVTAYTALVNLNTAYRNAANDSCLESSWTDSIAELSNITLSESSSRQWTYQTCNEFGYFQTAANENQAFYSFKDIMDLESFLRLCQEVYNITTLPEIEYTNSYYGGLDIHVHRVAFPSGSLDPWSKLAVNDTTKLSSPELYPIYIPYTAHCEDMHNGDGTLRTPELDAAKAKVASLVSHWSTTDETTDEKVTKIRETSAGIILTVCFFSLAIGIIMAISILTISSRRKNRRRLEIAMNRRSLREPLIGSL